MKPLIIATIALLGTSLANAQLKRTVEVGGGPGPIQSTKISWTKDGQKILTQTIPPESPEGLCTISVISPPKVDVILYMNSGRVVGLATKNTEFLVSLDDFTKDGNPDVLQLTDPKTKRVIEAFSIIHGIVEPIPDEKLNPSREEFYYDEGIISYLKEKEKTPNQTLEPTPTAVTPDADASVAPSAGAAHL